MMCVLPQNDAFPSAQWGYVAASAAVRLSLAARPPLASPVPPSRLRLMPGCGENRNDRSRWRRCPSLCRPGAGSCSRPAPRAAGTAPAGGVTGGAARPRSPPRAAAGPLPPSPGAAAGGRMEQGLSAITLYCAPAAGVMEPEQVSGAGGRLPRRSGRAAGPGRSRFRSGARPRRVRPARGGVAAAWGAGGARGWGSPRSPLWRRGAVARPRERRSVCLSASLPFYPARCNYRQRGGHACLRCLLLVGGQCLWQTSLMNIRVRQVSTSLRAVKLAKAWEEIRDSSS